MSQFLHLSQQACQPPQVAAVAALSSRHKVCPRPLLCFSRSPAEHHRCHLSPLKARASDPLPELLPPTTSDFGTKGGASAHRVGSSSALGSACDARFRACSRGTPSPHSELTPSHPLLLHRHPRYEQLSWQPRPVHPPHMPQPLQLPPRRGGMCPWLVCIAPASRPSSYRLVMLCRSTCHIEMRRIVRTQSW
jgi:hypothetical protein